jgi:hypothetical protein
VNYIEFLCSEGCRVVYHAANCQRTYVNEYRLKHNKKLARPLLLRRRL